VAQSAWKLPPADQPGPNGTVILAKSWQWQIDGRTLNLTPAQSGRTSVYDIDYEYYSAADVARLHALGQYVVAYMDIGAWESYRPDANQFPEAVKGPNTGWNGERYLDIRPAALAQYRAILEARFDLARSKGFDAVEGDYQNNIADCPGCFSVTEADQYAFNQWFIQAVHARGMAAILKNAPERAAYYATWPTAAYPHGYDGALNEQCNEYAECGGYAAFSRSTTRAWRPVWNAEYSGSQTTVCANDARLGLNGIKKRKSLSAAITWSCR
jgi:hypothetical protein